MCVLVLGVGDGDGGAVGSPRIPVAEDKADVGRAIGCPAPTQGNVVFWFLLENQFRQLERRRSPRWRGEGGAACPSEPGTVFVR